MPTVLVVDDSAVDRRRAGKLLAKCPGVKVVDAANGRAALEVLQRAAADLVLTDLKMPEMNGLELVEEVRRQHPDVPVVLMTAYGSEEIAVQALQKGAASYVPKRNLAQDLAGTVENVLALTQAARHQQRILECLTQTESHFLLHNDYALIAPLLGHLQNNLNRMKLCTEGSILRVTVALREALINAIEHGNLEASSALHEADEKAYAALVEQRLRQKPYQDRRVSVIARESPAEAVYTIRDEGPGFDPSGLPDPTDPANLERVSGRGLLLIRTFMDDVRHNATGNEITLVKRRDR
jgi:CheY-like chemotaxis protein/anti-sigma regulatory factor (Ser/Thr protein kinase)